MDDNISMWSYYTNNFKGFCCEFEFYGITNVDNCLISSINYDDKVKEIDLALIEQYEKIYELTQDNITKALKNTKLELIREIIKEISFNKGLSWEHEKEFRALYIKKKLSKNVSKPRKGKCVNFSDFNIRLKNIYFVGDKCSPNHIQELKEIGKKLKANVYEMKADKKSFKIVIDKEFKY